MPPKLKRFDAQIPANAKDAFYELVFYPVVASALQNEKFLLARDSINMAGKGDPNALKVGADAMRASDEIGRLTDIYNSSLAGGKWRGMMDANQNNRASFRMPPIATRAMLDQKPTPAYAMNFERGPVCGADKT